MNKVVKGIIDTTVESVFLKNCPFCGLRAYVMKNELGDGYIVACETLDCFGNTTYFDSKQQAKKAWNKRT